MTKPGTGTIYRLVDPRDGKIRYIGKTTQRPVDRLAGHLAKPTNPAMRVWINGLGMQGLTPRMETVTTAPVATLATEEDRQIRHHVKQGHRLLNAPYYQAHLGDLSEARAHQPQGARKAPPAALPGLAVAQWVFGPLAQARARGRVPAWVPGAVVIVGGPVYVALLLLRALFNTAFGIWLVLLGLVASMLWDAGFDAAVRDLLLPQMPVDEWSGLWSAYVAPPLANLAPSLAWALMATSTLLAGISYTEVAGAQPQAPRRRSPLKAEDVAAAAAAALDAASPPRPKRVPDSEAS
ncbi:hypothetical protein [Streptomyces sp. NPDC029554]|uniref:hypothetical protein n=1 Tax=Streptomyces sp. NPDC029554 TaxID=3155126 RepID=UPI00340DBF04